MDNLSRGLDRTQKRIIVAIGSERGWTDGEANSFHEAGTNLSVVLFESRYGNHRWTWDCVCDIRRALMRAAKKRKRENNRFFSEAKTKHVTLEEKISKHRL